MRPTAQAHELIDDEKVRVTRFEFAPGAETGWHNHAHDYVITAITDCQMTLEHPDGTITHTVVKAGQAYLRNIGVEHNVINRGPSVMSFVEVEMK